MTASSSLDDADLGRPANASRLHERGRQQMARQGEGGEAPSTSYAAAKPSRASPPLLPSAFICGNGSACHSVRPSRLDGGGGGLTLPADGARSDGIELPLLLHHPPSDGGEGAKNDHRTQGFLSSHAALNLEHFSATLIGRPYDTVLTTAQKFEMLFRISLQ